LPIDVAREIWEGDPPELGPVSPGKWQWAKLIGKLLVFAIGLFFGGKKGKGKNSA